MRKNICVDFLILSSLFTQGYQTLIENKIDESSDLHVRKKRIIDNTPNQNRLVLIQQVPYIVNILKNAVPNCSGSILLSTLIITAAHCVFDDAIYIVLSGSRHEDRGNLHDITTKIIYPLYRPDRLINDLALLIILPPIELDVHSVNQPIVLHRGPIAPRTLGTISGWGCCGIVSGRTVYPKQLRLITVPITTQARCRRAYEEYVQITDKEICTLDLCGRKRCGYGDSGGPLLVAGKLAGVAAFIGGLDIPDVFMNLTYPEYRNWVLSYIRYNRLG